MVICLEQGADLRTAQLMPCHSLSLASVKSSLVLPFWYWLTWVVPDKGPLNGCVCYQLLDWLIGWIGRRLLSAPLINSPSDAEHSTAAALGGHVDTTPSLDEFPSPVSSAAEALEMDTITFGQDATDLLETNTSTAGHS